jgi:hypothetical protein
MAANWPIPAAMVGSRRTATRVTRGAISLRRELVEAHGGRLAGPQRANPIDSVHDFLRLDRIVGVARPRTIKLSLFAATGKASALHCIDEDGKLSSLSAWTILLTIAREGSGGGPYNFICRHDTRSPHVPCADVEYIDAQLDPDHHSRRDPPGRARCLDFRFRAATGDRTSSASGPSPPMDKREDAMPQVRLEGLTLRVANVKRSIELTRSPRGDRQGPSICNDPRGRPDWRHDWTARAR